MCVTSVSPGDEGDSKELTSDQLCGQSVSQSVEAALTKTSEQDYDAFTLKERQEILSQLRATEGSGE